jgi:feruloyl esterase
MLSRPVCVLVALAAGLWMEQSALAQAQRCGDLNRLSLPGILIRSATPVPLGTFTPPAGTARTVPSFCRVVGTVLPELGFELWLPDQWNRKYVGVGNGGLAGNIVYSAMFDPLSRGYAVGSTDTGHIGANTNDGAWALGHMDRVINFGQRGVHAMAIADKLIIRAHYGASPAHSYFQGCSYGGKQALTEVQKYPTDFDGVIAGDPANWWTRHYTGGHLWVAQALEGDGYIPRAKVQVIADAVNAACDALDGLKDGILNDPRRCHFDPGELRCKSGGSPGFNYGDQSNCLTGAQVDAVRKIWNGPRDAEGQQLYPGLERGGEAGPGGWVQWISGPGPGRGGHFSLGLPFMKYVVYEDPNWDLRSFHFEAAPGFENDVEYVDDKLGRIFNAIDPDLRPFRANGGKLIQYHGWSDPDIPPANSLNYYESVVRRQDRNSNLGLRDTREFYRLFMVPGMQHCTGGPGPSRFDALTALEQWVEQNKAPEQITAAHVVNGQVDRTRPLCAYPQEAKYKGVGSSDDAANFVCAAP